MEYGWLYASLAAASGMIYAAWSYVRTLGRQITSRFIITARCTEETATAVQSFLTRECKPSRFGPRTYAGGKTLLPKWQRVEVVPYEVIDSTPRLYWYGRCPLFIKMDQQQQMHAGDKRSQDTWNSGLTITSIRWLVSLEQLTIMAVRQYNAQYSASAERRFEIVRYCSGNMSSPGSMSKGSDDSTELRNRRALLCCRLLMHTPDELNYPEVVSPGDTFDGLIQTPEMVSLRRRYEWWLNSREWYEERRLAWRDGWLLYGQPGTGKTSLIRSVAKYYDVPLLTLDLSNASNHQLTDMFMGAVRQAPAIILLEDIDAVFDGRQSKNRPIPGQPQVYIEGITFERMLECLDGVAQNHGVIVAMTTNHLEKLDPALIRPGRMNLKFEIGCFDRQQQRQLAEFLLGDAADQIEYTDYCAPANLTARCVELAIELKNKEFDSHVPGEKERQVV